MAEQVAHSLKGAIASLDLLLKNNQTIPQNVEAEIRASIIKMVNVSAGILDLKKSEARQLLALTDEKFNPDTLVKSVIKQKARLFPATQLVLNLDDEFEGLVFGPRVDFETTISDLIDNAIDAAPKGPIEIQINSTKASVEIVITDWGTGIAPEILPQLMQEGVTFKPKGNGLGLFHAKTTFEAMTGKIEIESKIGVGTKIKISVPRIENESIEVVAGQKVVLVDDDELVHKVWDLLLTPYVEKISLVHLQSKNEFEEWISTNGSGSLGERYYIFDYDLKADLNGIDLIEKYSLRLEAMLISGMADAPEVLARARGAKVKLLNKNGLQRTTIKVIETETKTPLEAVNQ
ncbi:MAG: HAMP domain-containing histidine kinase [Bdellovibrionales bacterium]|nr:HAMP domain-containing histidine kinase [Bdellovibrionales bacterium]